MENQPGQINQKGQLVSYHPGANKPWDCGICQEQLATKKLFEKHVREKDQVSEFLYFCECGYSSLTARGTGAHKKVVMGTHQWNISMSISVSYVCSAASRKMVC